MRLLTYTVYVDYGFAPNPFHGVCSLAACTPNHMRARLEPGDWIAGHSDVASGSRLIYAMRVERVATFEQYANDPAYAAKIPRFDQTWREECGDNIYVIQSNGKYKQRKSHFHLTKAEQQQDIKGNRVFIAKHFYYLGANAVPIPHQFAQLIWKRQGIKISHTSAVVSSFLKWIEDSVPFGISGEPRDLLSWFPSPGCTSSAAPVG